jgi:hypothetical protein
MVGWQGASAFTSMNNPLVPDFNTANGVVGLGPSGVVGVSGPFLASQAFRSFATNGTYPSPEILQQFPLGYIQRKFPNPYSEQASLEVESQLGGGWILTTGYQYLHALDLPVYFSVNGLPNGTLPDGRQSFAPADPRFGFALIATPSGFSIYNGGIVSVRKSFASHYSVLANYTYSKSIDIATDVQLTDTPQNYLDPSADRSVGDNDIRHRATLSFVAESPESWPQALRNLRLSMLNTLQSPRYYSILAGFNVLGDGFPFSIEPEPWDATRIAAYRTMTATCACSGCFILLNISRSSLPLRVSICSITAMCRASTRCMELRTFSAPFPISSAMELGAPPIPRLLLPISQARPVSFRRRCE